MFIRRLLCVCLVFSACLLAARGSPIAHGQVAEGGERLVPEFNFESRLLEDLQSEFKSEGTVERQGDSFKLSQGSTLRWTADKGPQSLIDFQVHWPQLQIESPTELEILFFPQSLTDLGLAALGVGVPCGVSLRSIREDGEFAWEVLHRSYSADGRPNRLLAKRIVSIADAGEQLQVSYNYGMVSLRLGNGSVLDAHLDNFCAGVKEIQLRCPGQPLAVSDIHGKRSKAAPLPSFFHRLKLIAAASWDHQSAELQRQQQFDEAVKLQQKLHAVLREILGIRHLYSIRSGTRLVWLYAATGDRTAADELIKDLLGTAIQEFGPNHPETARLLDEQALLFAMQDEWESANRIWRKSHRIRDPFGKRSIDVYLSDVAEDLRDSGRIQLAVVVRKHVLEQRQQNHSDGHWRIREARSLLAADERRLILTNTERHELKETQLLLDEADTQMKRGELQEALEKTTRVLSIRIRILGELDRDTAVVHSYLGLINKKLGRPEEAIRHYEADLKITREVQGERHSEYATVLNNFAQLLNDLSQYDEAEKMHLEALDIRKEHSNRYPNEYAESLSNLGRHYCFSLGAYEKGFPLIEQSYQVRVKHFAIDSLNVSRSLSNLGHFYDYIGDYHRALEYFRRSANVKKRFFGEQHLDYAIMLVSIGSSLSSSGETEQAISSLEKAVAIVKKLGGRRNTFYPKAINYLAAALVDNGESDRARELYAEALEIRSSQVGPQHLDCGGIQLNLARTSFRVGDYDRSLKECREAGRIIALAVGEDNPSTVIARNLEISILIAKDEQLEHAFSLNSRLLRGKEEEIRNRISILSEAQQLSRFRSLHSQLFKQLVLGKRIDADPYDIYRHVLRWKSAIGSRTLADKLEDSPRVAGLQKQLGEVRRRLTEYVYGRRHVNETQFLTGLHELESEKERLQRLIAAAGTRREAVQPQQLVDYLPQRSVLMDFLRVRSPLGDSRYYAFTLSASPDDELVIGWLDLGDADETELLIAAWRKSITSDNENGTLAKTLRERLWDPIITELGFDPDFAYICPDGALTAVPWYALPGRREDTYLIEDLTIATLPFTQYLLIRTNDEQGELANHRAERLLLVGNLDYEPRGDQADTASLFALRSLQVQLNGTQSWIPLPATAKEVSAIAKLAEKREVVRLEKHQATIPATIAALQSSSYAHFASHGFFATPVGSEPDLTSRNKVSWDDTLSRNPFLLSGVVLSGTNRSDGNGAPGLLNAEAIASLPLGNLQLVTLSACETGLGNVASGEGVYGLQRAFHLAGTKHVVASLWKVEDDATAALMELFYSYLWKHRLPPVEALRRAQLELIRNPAIINSSNALNESLVRGPALQSNVKIDAASRSRLKGRATPRQWAAFSVSGTMAPVVSE